MANEDNRWRAERCPNHLDKPSPVTYKDCDLCRTNLCGGCKRHPKTHQGRRTQCDSCAKKYQRTRQRQKERQEKESSTEESRYCSHCRRWRPSTMFQIPYALCSSCRVPPREMPSSPNCSPDACFDIASSIERDACFDIDSSIERDGLDENLEAPDFGNIGLEENLDKPDFGNIGLEENLDAPDLGNIGLEEDSDLPGIDNSGLDEDLGLPDIGNSDVEEESDASSSAKEEFRTRLRECLDDVQSDGSFSTFHTYQTYPNPGLHLSDYGYVGLPLAVDDAKAIMRICEQSSFGKGSESIIDTSLRRTWELDTTQFQCDNPFWASYLDSLAKQAIEDLGIQGEARAEQYKLLLDEEGASFETQEDSEKMAGMFGTLVICLPSKHVGGEVFIVQGGKEQVLQTAPTSTFGLSMLAWYSDVSNEVRRLTSGYRLVLTYNLVQDRTASKQTAATLDESYARFEGLLATWICDFIHLEKFIYPLTHQYTEPNLSLQSLKGQDAAKGRYLERLCRKNGVYWFFGRLTKKSGAKAFSLGHTVTPAGIVLNVDEDASEDGEIGVSRDEILADVQDLYVGRRAESKDEYDTVLILMRKERAVQLFLSWGCHNSNSLLACLKLLRDDHQVNPSEEGMRNFMDAMRMILTQAARVLSPRSTRYEEDNYRFASYESPDPARPRQDFSGVFSMAANYCHAIGQANLIREALQEVMRDSTWWTSSDLVRLVTSYVGLEAAGGGPATWLDLFLLPLPGLLTFKHANDIGIAFEVVKSHLPDPDAPWFDSWMEARLNGILRSISIYREEDVSALLHLLSSSSQERRMGIIIPILVSNPNEPAAISFLRQLGDSRAADERAQETLVKPTYRALISNESVIKVGMTHLVGLGPRVSHPVYLDFLAVLEHTISLGLEYEAQLLLSRGLPLVSRGSFAGWHSWQDVFLSIDKLSATLEKHPNSSNLQETVRSFITSVLEAAADWLLSQRPSEPKDWSRQPKSRCNCAPCQKLSRFLKNPIQTVGQFSHSRETCRHLQSTLDPADLKFDTESTGSSHALVVRKINKEFLRRNSGWRLELVRMHERGLSMWLRNERGKEVAKPAVIERLIRALV